MPVVVRTREYGSAASYKEFVSTGEAEKDIEQLWD